MTQKASTIFTKTELLDLVKAHAAANYEKDGWDFLVECFSDDEILKALGRSRKLAGAIWAVQTNLGLKLQDEVRGEARSEVF